MNLIAISVHFVHRFTYLVIAVNVVPFYFSGVVKNEEPDDQDVVRVTRSTIDGKTRHSLLLNGVEHNLLSSKTIKF